jgi:hypothetical protein
MVCLDLVNFRLASGTPTLGCTNQSWSAAGRGISAALVWKLEHLGRTVAIRECFISISVI